MKRVNDLADPRRCKGAAPDGQCQNFAEEGSDYCAAHCGKSNLPAIQTRQYLLAKADFRKRLAELGDHEDIKSLRDEIALARMLIEKRLNMVQTDNDILAACGPINQLLLTVERLVKSAHQIETNLGVLLARKSVLRLGQQICQIITEELEGIENYEEIVDSIINRIIETIKRANNSATDVKALEFESGDGS